MSETLIETLEQLLATFGATDVQDIETIIDERGALEQDYYFAACDVGIEFIIDQWGGEYAYPFTRSEFWANLREHEEFCVAARAAADAEEEVEEDLE